MKKAAIGMVALGSIAIVAAMAVRSKRAHKSPKLDTGETAPEAAGEITSTDAVQPA